MIDIGCLSNMYALFLQLEEWESFAAFVKFFGGVSPSVTAESNSLVDQLEAWLMCLRET